jgi:hypothetical protein
VGAALWLGGTLGRREWLAVIGMTAGTIGLIAFLGPRSGHGDDISWWWLLVIAATVGTAAIVFGLAHRVADPGRRATLLGISAGTTDGLAASPIKGMTEQFSHGGILAALTAWQLYDAIAAGLTALWLRQNAVNGRPAGRRAARDDSRRPLGLDHLGRGRIRGGVSWWDVDRPCDSLRRPDDRERRAARRSVGAARGAGRRGGATQPSE